MEFGYFDKKNKEYIIKTPLTPVRWVNYVGGLDFGGLIDQTGGLLLCKGDPAENRITKYIPQLPGGDMNGTAFYLRCGEKLFSPFFSPCRDKSESFECRVGLGYTTITSRIYGWELEGTFFVPKNHSTLIMDMRIRNISAPKGEIDFIPVVEYTHFEALKQFTNNDWVPQTMQSIKQEKNDKTALIQYAFMHRDIKWNYFTSNSPVSSIESDRSRFLGDWGSGSWAKPGSLLQKELNNSEAQRGDNIGALMHHLGVMAPGDEKRIILQLGQTEKIGHKIWNHLEPYFSEEKTDKAKEELAENWEEYLSKQQVKTPSDAMNNMLNVHHPKQCFITRNWSRYLSSYQMGLGARGIGFRDSSQDLLGVMQNDAQSALTLLKTLISMQKPDGSAMHQFNPLSLIANEGDSREREDRPDYYGDDHLWMVLGAAFYLKETGDLDFLNEEIPFYDHDAAVQAAARAGDRGDHPTVEDRKSEKANVWEHILRALQFSSKNTGEHGIPLLGFADWNDTVNLPSGSESILNASLYGWALKEAIAMARETGRVEKAEELQQMWQTMKERVNLHCWDGQWYIRWFTEKGEPMGSSKNDKGKIFVNGQSWPILAGFADKERSKEALKSVYEKLNTKHGIKVSWPGYDGYDREIGGITTFPPGTKENGGIFLHTNPWVIIAETLLGNGNRAFEYYDQINPASKKTETYECEPYCYAQNILSDEHPQFGLARNSWLSGTASWTYVAATQYILGIKPDYRGLTIDPVIPSEWKEYRISRRFRGAELDIFISNPQGKSCGVKSVRVDGKEIEGNTISVKKGEKLFVEVLLGE